MPCNDKPNRKRQKELPTLWEAFVLHKAAKKTVMLFDLELEEDKDRVDNGHGKKTRKCRRKQTMNPEQNNDMSESPNSHSTNAINMEETNPQQTSPKPESKLPTALLASLDCVRSLSRNSLATNPSTSSTHSKTSNEYVYFGPKQERLLSPTVLHDDAERQEALIKTSPLPEGLTRKRKLITVETVQPDDMIMSGALEAGDARCEVCEKRERAIEGLEDVGVVAL